jgi:hypothetical protein
LDCMKQHARTARLFDRPLQSAQTLLKGVHGRDPQI